MNKFFSFIPRRQDAFAVSIVVYNILVIIVQFCVVDILPNTFHANVLVTKVVKCMCGFSQTYYAIHVHIDRCNVISVHELLLPIDIFPSTLGRGQCLER